MSRVAKALATALELALIGLSAYFTIKLLGEAVKVYIPVPLNVLEFIQQIEAHVLGDRLELIIPRGEVEIKKKGDKYVVVAGDPKSNKRVVLGVKARSLIEKTASNGITTLVFSL